MANLQVAFGGYFLGESSTTSYEDDLDFKEPGFDVVGPALAPIEFAINKCDEFYFIIRKRTTIYNDTFADLSAADATVTAFDATTGQLLTATIQDMDESSVPYHAAWDDATSQRLILKIVNLKFATRIRVIDCKINYTTDNSLISFRVNVDDSQNNFHYITVNPQHITARDTMSAPGRSAIVDIVGNNDIYMLISPFVTLTETTQGSEQFSYPLNSIFYHRHQTYNEEGYIFQLLSPSHDFVLENVQVLSVPGYDKTAVLTMDKNLYSELQAVSVAESVFVDVEINSNISDTSDTFRVYFVRV